MSKQARMGHVFQLTRKGSILSTRKGFCMTNDAIGSTSVPAAAPILAYKGFSHDWTCRGFQYKVGDTFEHYGHVEACASGFHACENPLDVWNYYPMATSKFAVVEMSGAISRESSDSKIASARLKVTAEIGLSGIISGAVKYIMAMAQAVSESNAATTGESANAATTGNYANAATTGYRANAATTGYYANAATTGNYANAATTGNYANAATTGYYANAATTGESAVAASLGYASKAKAGKGGAIVVCHRDVDDRLIHIRASMVGQNGVEADTWYQLDDKGEFVAVV